ncbi:dicarboxylate transport [Novosphingobium sp. PhB165]|uniref:intermembrane phospholipid transport protein YdbH family protein n=1 Tax=Novosphingobium sp. PhB165 TaxID=2485105 RepID=UPI0010431EDF|nr:YdbH domain-containing protein [Novosphingobium sp. PhB165]TCM21563.1 dicarboxylate transport [Novosphingobium sp. PhB165]
MPEVPDQSNAPAELIRPFLRTRRGAAVTGVLGLFALGVSAVWVMREDIADNLIEHELAKLELPARYRIVRISPSEEVIRDLVIGDPRRPDLTIEEVRVTTDFSWGLPGIGRITLVRPRLYGSLHKGKLSLGTLDKALASGGGDKEHPLPDYDVALVDGRVLIESDYGRVAAQIDGAGPLRGGFAGQLAAISPGLTYQGCRTGRTTLYGKLRVQGEKPAFTGPLRIAGLDCPDRTLHADRADTQLELTFDRPLDGVEGRLGLEGGAVRLADNRLAGLTASGRFTFRKQALTATYKLAARGVATPQARADALGFDGQVRTDAGFAHVDIDGDVTGSGLVPGAMGDRALADLAKRGEGTLVASLANRIRVGLAREARGSRLDANLVLRRDGASWSLVVPRGNWRGTSGASLLALSRVQAVFGQSRPVITGNFASGGAGLPQVSGRMESGTDGRLALSVSMPEYLAGDSRLALPHLSLTQSADGTMTFTGEARLSGPLPGGRADGLVLPIEGRWAADGALALWPRCTTVAFDRLAVANLTLEKRSLPVCPAQGGSILRNDARGLTITAGVPSLDVTGRLGGTRIHVASGPVGYAQAPGRPGALTAKAVAVELGAADAPSRFRISHLDAEVGKDIAGTFDEGDIMLAAVPLDMHQAAGRWRYANDVLAIDGQSFTLVDRQQVPRFKLLIARDASLRLENGVVTAQALLREPTSDRGVVRADIVHDLNATTGHADLTVDGILFDKKVQAETLSPLLLGIVSNLEGTVSGTGRIEWNARGVTSHGQFSSDGLAFAAPFGPVKGLSGAVVFTDLLGLVTAPDQKLKLASINPGVEVTDGVLSFQLEPDYLLRINGARWPFMDGVLTLEPATMTMGASETRRYKITVKGLNAATFVQHLDLGNINATGVFDGELPLVFDENGGRIENGYLASRAPGGNVSYIGALTYKDLSAMGNFAFGALKSVDYSRMEIGLGGSLDGDILTRISFDGLSQGAGASKNFVTKQIAKLPIHFIVNVKAPFMSLFGNMRSLYDANYLKDPRLLSAEAAARAQAAAAAKTATDPASATIQPSDSEKKP